MNQESTTRLPESNAPWENWEAWIRGYVQAFIQRRLEEKATEFFGRQKSQRRQGLDHASGYRNGYGKAGQLTVSCGTITVKRPQVRDGDERLTSLSAASWRYGAARDQWFALSTYKVWTGLFIRSLIGSTLNVKTYPLSLYTSSLRSPGYLKRIDLFPEFRERVVSFGPYNLRKRP